jgi:hypothetical protein
MQIASSKKNYIFLLSFITLAICCRGTVSAQELIVQKTSQEIAREKLLNLFAGEWVSRGIYVATKLEIAEHLHTGPKSIEELASYLNQIPILSID